jgi:hypothetical protein
MNLDGREGNEPRLANGPKHATAIIYKILDGKRAKNPAARRLRTGGAGTEKRPIQGKRVTDARCRVNAISRK